MLLIDCLVTPARCRRLDALQWDQLIREARHANLLGRLHHQLLGQTVPPRALAHLRSAAQMAERQHQSVRHEARLLRDTLATLGLPLILLKGAAYVLAELPAARGRVFADVDILVPRACLAELESALLLTGWASACTSAYDQHYYRRWMHELPPMSHTRRGTALDVHHALLPLTSRLHPDPALLIAESMDVPGWPGVRTLAPADMILHSATHLFHEGEPDNLLRDLSDLDLLLRHFAEADAAAGFWPQLFARAERLGLTTPLRLALRYAHRLLQTPVPETVLQASGADRPREPLDRLYLPLLNARASRAPLARRLLYLRGHYLRMPLPLLAWHLLNKAFLVQR